MDERRRGSQPPAPRIVGYWIGRKVTQSEIPTTISVKAKDAVGMLGHGDTQYVVPPGVDVLELGLVANPGQFVLIPFSDDQNSLWDQTHTLLVTEEQAAVQRDINARFYAALLAQLPYDASDLESAVAESRKLGKLHPIFGLLRQAATDTWAAERRPSEQLDDNERNRLDIAVARRAAELLREKSPRCRMDRQSVRAILKWQIGCSWDHIFDSVSRGDYDDAIIRVVARVKLKRGLKMPVSCILQVLPGVQRLDIFFLIVGRASVNPVGELHEWLLRQEPLGPDPASAELAVRALYASWRMEADPVAAKTMMRAHVYRIQHEPVSDDARRIKRWLETVPKVDGEYLIPEGDLPLFEGMNDPLERWDRALFTTVDEIIVSLPERAVD
jgi:hypothetical protein